MRKAINILRAHRQVGSRKTPNCLPAGWKGLETNPQPDGLSVSAPLHATRWVRPTALQAGTRPRSFALSTYEGIVQSESFSATPGSAVHACDVTS